MFSKINKNFNLVTFYPQRNIPSDLILGIGFPSPCTLLFLEFSIAAL